MRRRSAEQLRLIEIHDAWFEYLTAIRYAQGDGTYEYVEPMAWGRLKRRLDATAGSRRARVH